MACWQPTTSKCGKDTPTSDLSVSQHTSSASSEWSSLPHDILSQLFAAVQAGSAFTATCFCGVCKSWSMCPTTWRTCRENAPWRPQRCPHLAHLTLEEQPFGYAEALMISRLPSLQSLCLKQPATFGALSVTVAAPEGHTLPAPCMLTHLTSLSLMQWPLPELASLSGVSVLTNLQSLSWSGAGWALAEGMILDSLQSVNNVTKLICRPVGFRAPLLGLSPLLKFRTVQHLVFDIKPTKARLYCWETLGMLSWVTELDIQWVWVEVAQDEGLVSLLQALRAMQLTSLQLSFHVTSRVERDATQVLNQMDRLSHLACLHKLTVMCRFRPYIYMQKSVSRLQSSLQAHLKDARVQVTSLVDPIVVLPVART